jgi:hypothetical protein
MVVSTHRKNAKPKHLENVGFIKAPYQRGTEREKHNTNHILKATV